MRRIPIRASALFVLFTVRLAPPAAGARAAEPPAPPVRDDLLRLAIRAPEERAGDYDALAARWVEEVARRGGPGLPASGPGSPDELRSPGGPLAPGSTELWVPDSLALELVLRRLSTIRPHLADGLKLVPAVEAAAALGYRDGLHSQLVRGLLEELSRSAGNGKWRDVRRASGHIRRWAVCGPFGIGGPSQFLRRFPPEEGIDPAGSYAGRKGKVSWRVPPRPDAASARIFPSRWVYPHEGVVYLLAEVPVEADGRWDAVLHHAGPEPVAIWVNGAKVVEEKPGDYGDTRRATGVVLEPGVNRVLVKTIARPGAGLWVRVAGVDGAPLPWSIDRPLDRPAPGKLALAAPPEPGGEPRTRVPYRAGSTRGWEEIVEAMEKEKVPADRQADARIGLAILESLLGRHHRAVLHAEKALALAPGDAAVQAHAGEVLLAAGYLPRDHARGRAKAAFDAALRADPDWLPAYVPLARFLADDNEASAAARKLEEAIGRRGGFFAARLELLRLFGAREWEAEGDEAAATLAAIAPRHPAAALHRGRQYRGRGNPAAALRELRAALALDRARTDVLDDVAALQEETGDAAGAEETWGLRRALDPEDGDAIDGLARLFESRRQWDRAIAVRKEAEAANPADPGPAEAIGRVLEQAGKPAEAAAWFDRALEREPGDIELARHRAGLAAAGGVEGAREDFWEPYDEDLDAILSKVPPPDPNSNAGAQVILDIGVLRLYPDGSSSEYVHQAERLLSEEAKDEVASVEAPGEVVRLRTITADGRTLEPVAATGKEEYTMPAVAPGAIVEHAYRADRARFSGWNVEASAFFFQDFSYKRPFLLSRYAVLLPPGLDVDLVERAMARGEAAASRGGVAAVRKEVRDLPGGGRAVIYEARDAARIEPEIGMPLREDYLPNVQVQGKRTWDDVASVLEDRGVDLTRSTPELERAAAQALAADKTPASAAGGVPEAIAKAKAIYRWVNDLVAEPAGPRDATGILITRSGDRTVLFEALLERAGVPVRWAFVRPKDALLPRDDGSHPRPDRFNSRYVLVDPDGPAPAWVSLAVRRSPFGKLPVAVQGGMALVLEPGGGARFAAVPAEAPEASSTSTAADLTLSGPGVPDLGARAKVEFITRAVEAYAGKERFRTLQEDLKRQALSAMAGRLFPGAKAIAASVPGLDDPDAPMALSLEVEAPRLLTPGGGPGELLLRPVLQPLEMVRRFVGRPRREHPYRVPGEMVVRDRSVIRTGPGLRIEKIPESVTQVSPLGTYSLTFRREGPDPAAKEPAKDWERIVVEREVTISPATLPREEFGRVLEFSRAVDQAEEARIVLRRTAAPENTRP